MSSVLVLNEADVRALISLKDCLLAVEGAYRQKAEGKASAWPMVYEQFEPGVSDMDIRSGELKNSDLFGLKLTSWFSENNKRNLPALFSSSLICSNKTGEPLALVNTGALTGFRTGAAAALGAKYLANKDSKVATIAGCGHMSAYMAVALMVAMPTLKTIYMWDKMQAEHEKCAVENVLALALEHVDADVLSAIEVAAAGDGEQAIGQSDIVVTITPAATPLFPASWVRPGTHISAVGADMEGKQELADELYGKARLFADDIAQSLSSGEFEKPYKANVIVRGDIVGEIGQVMCSEVLGRTSDQDITIFDTSGLFIQDLAAIDALYTRAKQGHVGTLVTL